MSGNYHIDATKVSLKKLERSLKSRDLIPSRVILKDKLKFRFELIAKAGVRNLDELLGVLKSSATIEAFAKKTGIDVEYLKLLAREARSYFPNPVKLSGFPEVDQKVVSKLDKLGLKNSKHLFDRTRSASDLKRICKETGISKKDLLDLVHLSDLSRLYGVGPVFAKLLYSTGIDSVESFFSYNPKEIVKLYEEKNKKKADFSESDIKFTLEIAREL
ncbi:MAG: DUF4332 domain-containing protein [Proteobacteria bacterium]|nr:DUF4332 domain-containing protein [Pseudomonadota bacterium]